jgi:hypothetical protein
MYLLDVDRIAKTAMDGRRILDLTGLYVANRSEPRSLASLARWPHFWEPKTGIVP